MRITRTFRDKDHHAQALTVNTADERVELRQRGGINTEDFIMLNREQVEGLVVMLDLWLGDNE